MEKLGIIYCYKNKVNGKCYIGQTVDPKKRSECHRRAYNTGVISAFHRAINKYGFDNFEYSILHENKTRKELDILEKTEIENHKSIVPFGYNLRSGGNASCQHSETIKKITASNKDNWSNPKFVSEKMEYYQSKEYSDLLKSKISEKDISIRKSWVEKAQETRKRNYAPIKARNDRIRDVLSFVTKAERKRYHATEEYKALRRANSEPRPVNVSACIPVFCITNGIAYISATDAARALSIDQGAISKIIRGDGHSTSGYYFRKATDNEAQEVKARYACS